MARSAMLHIRVDDDVKAQTTEALALMGLAVSDRGCRAHPAQACGQRSGVPAETQGAQCPDPRRDGRGAKRHRELPPPLGALEPLWAIRCSDAHRIDCSLFTQSHRS